MITGQRLAGSGAHWAQIVSNIGVIPLPGISGGNLRHGFHAIDAFASHGDDLARYIGKAAKSCNINSFSEKTPVTTDEGAIPISEVDVGDKVLAWDEALAPSGLPTGYYTITATWAHEDPVTVTHHRQSFAP